MKKKENNKTEENPDRLEFIEELLEKKDKQKNGLFWIRWKPGSKFGYEINDAREDINWMIYEIKRLQQENKELKEFVDSFRKALEDELSD